MARLQFRFTRSNTLVSWIIRFLTWSRCSHVELRTSAGFLGALPKGGVQERPFDYDPDCQWLYRSVRVTPDQAKAVLYFMERQIGKPYDWGAVLGWPLRRDWHQAEHWDCSELIMAALEWAGVVIIRTRTNRVTPEMLLELEVMQ